MASSKTTKRSANMTDHMMNLINKPSDAPEEEAPVALEPEEQSAEPAAAAAPKEPEKPAETPPEEPVVEVSPEPEPAPEPEPELEPVVEVAPPEEGPSLFSTVSDEAVAQTIKGALEDALAAEPPAPPEPAPPPEEPEVKTEAPQPAAPPAPKAETPPPVPAAAPSQDQTKVNYVNVMEVLVEENAEKYMKMTGVCTCPRCTVDVKALALNNLVPKYVVMSNQGETVPRITLYEGRFRTSVTAQLIQACETVQKNPRH